MENSIDVIIEPCKSEIAEIKIKGEEEEEDSASILTRINAGYFIICLSLGAQALLLNALIDNKKIRKISIINIPNISILMQWLSFCTLTLISCLYALRCIFHFFLVKAEFSHSIAFNFLFLPWISWLLLLRSSPPKILTNFPHGVLLWALITPMVILDVKIYGQWFTTDRRSLSLVANPTSHFPMMANFVGAWAAAGVGWKETALALFSIGLVHYFVVFITLYQRFSGSTRFRAGLRPVSFLFFGTPSAACLAWSSISGGFGVPCKLLFFLSLFLLASLICRPMYFKKSMKRFSVAWWAYSFPLSFVALAAAQYAEEVEGAAAAALMLLLSSLSLLVFLGIFTLTALNSDRLLRQNDACLSFS